MSAISWLDRLSGAIIRYLGTDFSQRGTIEFAGDGVVVIDDASNDKTVVTIAGGAGSVDLTADVTGVLPIANGGTGSSTDLINPAVVAMGALNIDWNAGDIHTKTLAAGANVFTMSNVGTKRKVVSVRVTGAASTLTWDPGAGPPILFPGGTPPTQSPSGEDVYTLMYDGTSVYVMGGAQAFA